MTRVVFASCVALLIQARFSVADPYYGRPIGDLSRLAHNVQGTVYAATPRVLVINGFSYDGTAPDAFIWIGSSASVDGSGTIMSEIVGVEVKLRKYDNEQLIVRLPPAAPTIADFRWISVWCRQVGVNFGDVYLEDGFTNPAPFNLGRLPTKAHGVGATSVRIEDAKTVTFESLSYDGNGPDAYFWGDVQTPPTTRGTKLNWITGRDNSGENQVLPRSFTRETITVFMPGQSTIYDYNNFGLWCVLARQNFGDVSYDPRTFYVPAVIDVEPEVPTFPNCMVLKENEFQVQWRVDEALITIELAGRVSPGEYMAFGPSGSDTRTLMEGSDVAVAWVNTADMLPVVVDYNLESKAQCSINDGRGVCPDTTATVGGTDDVNIVQVIFEGGVSRISYTRALDTGDTNDKNILLDRLVYISWAIGPINNDGRVAKHSSVPTDFPGPQINFGQASSQCPPLDVAAGGGSSLPAWPQLEINDATTFRVEIGQSGGQRGYTALTGSTGWGIAWYVNDLLIPVITVQRGVNYIFQVYGGNDQDNSARNHPFYITNDPVGGHSQKTREEKMRVTIYAGPVDGPYCLWSVALTGSSPDDFDSFGGYRTTLERNCLAGNPGIINWTPDDDTPDVVYYQCYTHRYLGWKIKVSSAATSAATSAETFAETSAVTYAEISEATTIRVSILLLSAVVAITSLF